ncbi:MAG: death domain-containing protein, partial [Proteobacteria bacterium]|nr:death domain-containing protein [Pseudomonadota bacterium]
RREALHIWRRKNGSGATYSKLIEAFERAKCKKYADEVRMIVQPSNSKTVPSSEEHSQPQVYPVSDEPQLLSQVPPAMHKPTVVYKKREGTLPEGMFANYLIMMYNAVKHFSYYTSLCMQQQYTPCVLHKVFVYAIF